MKSDSKTADPDRIGSFVSVLEKLQEEASDFWREERILGR
jgi:hypothetical protein